MTQPRFCSTTARFCPLSSVLCLLSSVFCPLSSVLVLCPLAETTPMTESCPRCGALVTYYASDIGGTVTCRSCNEPLRVTSDGLVRTSGAKAPPPVPAQVPVPVNSPPPAAPARAGGFSDAFGVLLGFLFLPGLFLTLLFLLLPVLHRAWIHWRDAAGMELDLPIAKARQELERKKGDKLDEILKKEKELKYKQADLRDRRRELDEREKELVKANAGKNEFDALGRD